MSTLLTVVRKGFFHPTLQEGENRGEQQVNDPD
jgi:hypothetical protein